MVIGVTHGPIRVIRGKKQYPLTPSHITEDGDGRPPYCSRNLWQNGKRPLLLPRKGTLNSAVKPQLNAIDVLNGRKVFWMLSDNLARLKIFFVG